MRIKFIVMSLTLAACTSAYSQQFGDTPPECGDDGTLAQAREQAIEKAQQRVNEDPFLEEVAKQREADQECMLDLSKELGGFVNSDSSGFGPLVDELFKQVNSSVCDVMNKGSQQQAGGTMPSIDTGAMAAQQSSFVPSTPPVIPPQQGGRTDDVWQRLSDAMAGISRD